jgi:hypothetical protein
MVETLTAPQKTITYKCSCGEQIRILPDLDKMVKVISTHVLEHNKLTKRCITEEALAREIIKTIAKQ